ncbi:MAG TPA: hypothetical protein VLK22_02595 [Candidatus Udaeobacter sp.]|nr:hypothetical protein [Candidatus Udaeobacter sp.]
MKTVATKVVLFLLLLAYYGVIIITHWSKETPFSWGYLVGMAAALAAILFERWGKYFRTKGFNWWMLIKKQLVALLIIGPAEVTEILPRLGPAKGDFLTDFVTAFMFSFVFIMMSTKAPKVTSRTKSKLLTSKEEKEAG